MGRNLRVALAFGCLTFLVQNPALSANVSLAWNASSGVTGYKVYYGGASRAYTNSVNAGSSTTAVVSGLIAGRTYYFGATAVGTNGIESDFSNEISYTVPGGGGNLSPTINPIGDITIYENAGLQIVNFTGVSAGAGESQTLTVTVSSSNTGLIPTPTMVYTSPSATGSVRFTPVANASGTATVTVTVNDGQAIATRSFTVTVNGTAPTQLTLNKNGNGMVTPDLSKSQLRLGTRYSMTAVPAIGYEFAGWTGSTSTLSTILTFVMTSNLMFEAKFIPSPYLPVVGSYNGLFYEDDAVRLHSAGFFKLSVTSRGLYTGTLQLGRDRFILRGKLNLQRQATNVITRRLAAPLTVRITVSTNQINQVTGTVTDGSWVADMSGGRNPFNVRSNPAPQAGKYTLVIPGQDDEPLLPKGDGYGTARVLTTGMAIFAGTLADGTRVNQTAYLTPDGAWPMYASLYNGYGAMVSWMTFANDADSDLNGALSWIKQSNNIVKKYYPLGFTNETKAIGSVYIAPIGTNKLLNLTDAIVSFEGGNISGDFSNNVRLGAYSRVTNLSSNKLTMIFSTALGTFSGSVTDPVSGKLHRFNGVAFQKLNVGAGMILGTNLSSRVTFFGNPPPS